MIPLRGSPLYLEAGTEHHHRRRRRREPATTTTATTKSEEEGGFLRWCEKYYHWVHALINSLTPNAEAYRPTFPYCIIRPSPTTALPLNIRSLFEQYWKKKDLEFSKALWKNCLKVHWGGLVGDFCCWYKNTLISGSYWSMLGKHVLCPKGMRHCSLFKTFPAMAHILSNQYFHCFS